MWHACPNMYCNIFCRFSSRSSSYGSQCRSVCLSVGWSSPPLWSRLNISITRRLNAMQFCRDLHGPQREIPTDWWFPDFASSASSRLTILTFSEMPWKLLDGLSFIFVLTFQTLVSTRSILMRRQCSRSAAGPLWWSHSVLWLPHVYCAYSILWRAYCMGGIWF